MARLFGLLDKASPRLPEQSFSTFGEGVSSLREETLPESTIIPPGHMLGEGDDVNMATEKSTSWRTPASIPEPPLSRLLFGDTRLSFLWLLLRVWLGWQWLQAGLGKVGSPAWTGESAGTAVSGYLSGVLTGEGAPGWYVWFVENVVLPNAALFSWLVAWGEVLVGLGLIFGLLTGIAAFFGTLMNLSFLFAGTVSTNPLMFVVGTWLVLAWRNAGWYGVDRWVLPTLGTPWQPGALFDRDTSQ